MARTIRRESRTLRPRARIVRTIGRDLISNEIVALIELIKNSYDADATKVTVTFDEPLEIGEGSITVADNGTGMTLSTIESAWFEPATISKVQRTHTAKKRRVTGEKGIGRFAAARIARTLHMTTIAKKPHESVSVRFDWGAFDDESRYLDEIKVRWECTPVPPRTRTGTTLKLQELNSSWDDSMFEQLRSELSRLVAATPKHHKFQIELRLPERFAEYSGPVSLPPILGRPHYKFKGRVDGSAKLTGEYTGPDAPNGISFSESISLAGGRKPKCGPFQFEFRVWDRDRAGLDPLIDELGSSISQLRKDLDSACGISIYRDNFRVLMGDPDWLRLDTRRIQNPTMRLSNFQVVGSVHVSADQNAGLRDQSNREGIVSSQAFSDFRKVLIELLSKIEERRDTHRRGDEVKRALPSIFEALSLEPVKDIVARKYPRDKELLGFIDEQARSIDHGVAEVQKVISRYRRLATLGQLIDVILHDGRTPIAKIQNEVELLQSARTEGKTIEDATVLKALERIESSTKFLDGLINRLSPFGGRKRGRPAQTTIERIISESFDFFKKPIEKSRIKVILPSGETTVTLDEVEIKEILINLIDNSIYWLEKVPPEKRRIEVQVSRVDDRLEIIFADSGPGVEEEFVNRIFDPYFSSKPDGIGLGLTIAGEAAAEYNGGLELIESDTLPGATFRVTLRKRIGGD